MICREIGARAASLVKLPWRQLPAFTYRALFVAPIMAPGRASIEQNPLTPVVEQTLINDFFSGNPCSSLPGDVVLDPHSHIECLSSARIAIHRICFGSVVR